MQLIPQTKIKTFAECEHGEFIRIRVRSAFHSGLCIAGEDGKKEFLPLDTPNPDHHFLLLKLGPDEAVMSFGADWVLAPSNSMSSPTDAFNHPGTLLHSVDGLYLVCWRNSGGFTDEAVCRLDKPAIRTGAGLPTVSFADAAWEIRLIDADKHLNMVLASKLETAS